MSSYVSFWVKNQKGQVTKLFDYCRSNKIYQVMLECGCRGSKDEKAEPFTLDMAAEARKSLDIREREINKYIREYKEKIEMVKDFKNTTLEERLSAIEDYQASIDEYKEELDEVNFTIDILIFIEEVRESNCSFTAPREEKDKVIWAGIDCGMEGVEEND